jgi:hypothetical protein
MAKQKMLIDTPQQSSDKDSLVSLLSEKPQDDLLGEALGRPSALNFNKATNDAREEFEKLKATTNSTQTQADEAEAQAPTPVEGEETPTEEEVPQPAASKEDESRWFALNEEQQRYAQRQELLERELLAERQRSNEAMERLQKSIPQPQQEAYPYDFTNPEDIRKYRAEIEREVMGQVRMSQEPLLRRMAQKDFQSAISKMQTTHEHFKNYFPEQTLYQYFLGAVNRLPMDQVLGIDWEKELGLAYQAADYKRLEKEISQLKRVGEVEKKSASSQKEEQKANLKLVPKANAKGSTVKAGINDELDEWRKASPGRFGIEDISANLKRKLGLG